jgi:hypothetical protein
MGRERPHSVGAFFCARKALEMDLITRKSTAALNAPDNPLPLTAHFVYNPEQSLVVQLLLVLQMKMGDGRVIHDQQRWEFSREILDEAFSKPGETAGLADVKITYLEDPDVIVAAGIWLGEHQLKIDLYDTDENTRPIYCDAEPVIDFMAASLRAVPVGLETASVDLDDEIERFLTEEGA